MVLGTARRRSSQRHRLAKRGVLVALPLMVGFGGAIISTSAAASAATTSTDSIIIANGASQTVVPLPAGTPDVVTPVATAVSDLCSGPGVSTNAVAVCSSEQFGPGAGTVVVVAVGPTGVAIPTSFGGGLTDCIVVANGPTAVALAPPGPPC